ncbi:MAG: alcohol dehydrogenase catalytic domain-containing protein [Nitrospinae bacterium]|nr:alcohol dehydrogenase catalytic domain-containing protein [Nitrospinota bacterium]
MLALKLDNVITLDRDYPVPATNPGEALIRPTLAGICNTDLELAKGYMGFKGVLGHEFVGVVEQSDESRFVGKRVTGEINCPCGNCNMCRTGLGNHCPSRTVLGIVNRDGAFCERFVLPNANLHVVPDSVSDRQAVFTEPLAAAFQINNQVPIGPFHKVALLGDGKLGFLIAQTLAITGCGLTVVGRHPERLEFLKTKGVEFKTESQTQTLGRAFDVVVDATGSQTGLATAARLVKPRGVIVLKTTVAQPGGFDLNQLVIDEITVTGSRCGPFVEALAALEKNLIETGPLIASAQPLENGVEAMKMAAQSGGRKILLKIS